MWFAGSLLGLIVLIWCADLAATPVVRLLPWRQQPAAQLFLGPLLGLAMLMFLATAFGWLGHGYRQWLCVPLTLALPVVGMGVARQGPSFRRLAGLAIFTTVASFPTLGSLLWYGAFNPFNDTLFYLVQAQWLQTHGFLEPAQPTGHHPIWSLVRTFQLGGIRMGGSFLLGWLQAGLGARWSYEVYPMASALAVVTGALAVGGAVATVCPGRRLESALAALGTAAAVNGFASGAVCGFFHQTFGLAFLAGALVLRGIAMTDDRPRTADPPPVANRLKKASPLAVCMAAVFWSYPEVSPFMVVAVGLSYFFPWPRGFSGWRRCWNEFWPPALLVVALVNFEWVRVARAVPGQAGVVSGWPVAWAAWEFAAHALGLKTSTYDGSQWPVGAKLWTMIGAGMAGSAVLFLLGWQLPGCRLFLERRPGRKTWSQALVPTLLLLGVMALGFAVMRWFVRSPWPVGTGQSWTQARISGWAGPACVAAVVGGAALLSTRWGRGGRGALVFALALWCGGGLGWNCKRMRRRTEPILQANALNDRPYAAYLDLRKSLAGVPASARVRLTMKDTGFFQSKTRQMLAYFLCDREIVGNWSVDAGLLWDYLPPSERNIEAETCEWRVVYRQPDPTAWKTGNGPTSDCFVLEREPAVSGQTAPPP